MTFTPDPIASSETAPYFEDVSKASGWAGFSTTKSIDTLLTEVTAALSRIGAMLTDIQSGVFIDDKNRKRHGYVIRYIYKLPSGQGMEGKIETMGLPMKSPSPAKEKAVRQMVLFLLRDTLKGFFYQQQTSPGYFGLMTWMLAKEGDVTIGQKFVTQLELPVPKEEIHEGQFKEV